MSPFQIQILLKNKVGLFFWNYFYESLLYLDGDLNYLLYTTYLSDSFYSVLDVQQKQFKINNVVVPPFCKYIANILQFSSVAQSCPTLCDPMNSSMPVLPSITNSQSSPKLLCIQSVMPSSHLILCHPLLLLPSIFPSIRIFSNESALHMRWPKYWSFSFSFSPSKEHSGLWWITQYSYRQNCTW